MHPLNNLCRSALPITAIASIGMIAAAPTAFGQANIDLNTWSQGGPAGSGNWTVAPDGSNVFQSINGAPTMYVSPNVFFNTTVNGSFGVETTGDDDFIGFVFGLQQPQADGGDFDFLLFDWKQNPQSGAGEGFTLSYINGNGYGSDGTGNPLWDKEETDSAANGVHLIATNFGDGLGWADNVAYDFSLQYGADQITIGIDGGAFDNQTIFDIAFDDLDPTNPLASSTAFPSGQFGFYNFSQADVRYQGFTQADDPVLMTTPGNGGTLDLGTARAGSGNAATGSLTVENAGGIGSNLTGSADAAAAPFDGAGGTFDLDPGESTTFGYAYTPTARGTQTGSVIINADAPAGDHTITLSGTGVGPVTQVTGDDAGTFDFGDVDFNETATLDFILTNVTPDTGDLALVGLTTDFEITGADADHFTLVLTPGTEFDAGDSDTFDLIFDPEGETGVITATLTLLTDQNAAFGDTATGESFNFTLVANSIVPEPTSLALLGLGGLTLFRRRR